MKRHLESMWRIHIEYGQPGKSGERVSDRNERWRRDMLVVFKSSEKPKGFGLCILFLLGLNRR
jgi:hypothetical protein